jgi:plastocyanin domain-containing protein
MKMKAIVSAAIVLIATAAIVVAQGAGAAQKKDAPKVQVVKLSFDDKGYVVTPATVTKGIPVKMEVDLDTVKGCMRTVVIKDFDVKKTVKTGDTTIEFTPTKSGPIPIICGMNMGKGSMSVVEPK